MVADRSSRSSSHAAKNATSAGRSDFFGLKCSSTFDRPNSNRFCVPYRDGNNAIVIPRWYADVTGDGLTDIIGWPYTVPQSQYVTYYVRPNLGGHTFGNAVGFIVDTGVNP